MNVEIHIGIHTAIQPVPGIIWTLKLQLVKEWRFPADDSTVVEESFLEALGRRRRRPGFAHTTRQLLCRHVNTRVSVRQARYNMIFYRVLSRARVLCSVTGNPSFL